MRIIVGISGASGAILGINLLQALRRIEECETHLIITDGGKRTIEQETDWTVDKVGGLANYCHDNTDLAASVASGSFRTDGMILVPCSMKTAAGMAHGYSDNLLLRTADVCIKEKRRVVVVPRETPLSLIHLRNLSLLAEYGCMIIPPVLSFYNHPQSVQDMITTLLGKIFMTFDLHLDEFVSWQGARAVPPKDLG